MWKLRPYSTKNESMFKADGVEPILARLLAQRIANPKNAERFLSTDYPNLRHPSSLPNMESAVEHFVDAVKNKRSIAVLGDYDADGVVSGTMMKELCRAVGVDCHVFLPSRLEHNYGLSGKSAEAFKSMHKNDPPYIVFLLDCGSNNKTEIEDLKAMGIKKVVVIDHHIITEEKGSYNADSFVNWHLGEEKEEMCTCGLMFQFIRGVRWKGLNVNPIAFLTYAAIGTIADVSPIVGDNRIIVKNGLTGYALNSVSASGLHSLIGRDTLAKGYLTQEDVSFKIAPRINAVGRIKHPDLAFGLLVELDPGAADKIATEVIESNDERKTIQKKAEVEASSFVGEQHKHGIFLVKDDWHIGVAGIVASRIVEDFGKPAIIVGSYNGVYRGSGRSVKGVNVKEILDDCKEMFSAYGGHAMACGVTLKPEYIDRANQMFNDACERYYSKHNVDLERHRYYDMTLKIDSVNMELATLLSEKMAPYCEATNPEPVFLLKNVRVFEVFRKDYQQGKYKILKFKVSKDEKTLPYTFLSFQLSRRFGEEIEGKHMNVYFKMPQSPDAKFELQLVDLETV